MPAVQACQRVRNWLSQHAAAHERRTSPPEYLPPDIADICPPSWDPSSSSVEDTLGHTLTPSASGMCQFTRFVSAQSDVLWIPSDNVLPVFRGFSSFLFMLLRFQFKAGFGILQSFILVTCPSHLYPVPNPKGPKPQSLPNPVTVSPHTKALYTACWLNGTEMTCRNWPATSRPSYTTRSLVTRVSVTNWLAAAKLGRLVLSQFVRCEHFHWQACIQNSDSASYCF